MCLLMATPQSVLSSHPANSHFLYFSFFVCMFIETGSLYVLELSLDEAGLELKEIHR